MEIFVDGGLFEIIILLGAAYLVNLVYRKKYLLQLYSILVILSPVGLFFLRGKELLIILIIFCSLNSILLVVLLWQQKASAPGKPLFDLDKWKRFLPFKKPIKPSFKS